MAIIPYTSLDAHTSGKYAATAVNFPAAKHFFRCDSSAAALTDVIGGLVVNGAGSVANTVEANGTLTLGETKNVLSAGTLIAPGTRGVLILHIGKPSSNVTTLIYGKNSTTIDPSNNTIKLNNSLNTNQANISNGNGASILVVPSAPAGISGDGVVIQARALAIRWNTVGGAQTFDFDGTTYTARTAVDTTGGLFDNMNTVDQLIHCGGVSSRPASKQVWMFNELFPSTKEIEEMIRWTYAMIVNKPGGLARKFLYPGWKGRA